jgi:hypothetical protein
MSIWILKNAGNFVLVEGRLVLRREPSRGISSSIVIVFVVVVVIDDRLSQDFSVQSLISDRKHGSRFPNRDKDFSLSFSIPVGTLRLHLQQIPLLKKQLYGEHRLQYNPLLNPTCFGGTPPSSGSLHNNI